MGNKLDEAKKWIKEHKRVIVKVGAGLGLAAFSAYLGYRYALSLEDVIDMRDEDQARRVDNVIESVEEIGGISMSSFIHKYCPELAKQFTEFLDSRSDIQDKFPSITYDLSKGTVECQINETKVFKF